MKMKCDPQAAPEGIFIKNRMEAKSRLWFHTRVKEAQIRLGDTMCRLGEDMC